VNATVATVRGSVNHAGTVRRVGAQRDAVGVRREALVALPRPTPKRVRQLVTAAETGGAPAFGGGPNMAAQILAQEDEARRDALRTKREENAVAAAAADTELGARKGGA